MYGGWDPHVIRTEWSLITCWECIRALGLKGDLDREARED